MAAKAAHRAPCPLHFPVPGRLGRPPRGARARAQAAPQTAVACRRRALTQVCQAAPTERAPRTAARGGSVQDRAAATLGVACGRNGSAAAAGARAAAAEPSGVMAACCSLPGAERRRWGPGRLGWGGLHS